MSSSRPLIVKRAHVSCRQGGLLAIGQFSSGLRLHTCTKYVCMYTSHPCHITLMYVLQALSTIFHDDSACLRLRPEYSMHAREQKGWR